MTKLALMPKDGATSLLTAGISAVATSIPITAASGALYPQSYNGSATSLGDAVTLNSTGISAAIGGSGAVGKFIYNATDLSWAKITAVATNAVTCTRLNGGTNNIWSNSDKYYIDPFVATLAVVSTSAYGVKTVTASEKVLIIGRSTDTLTVATGGRGYDGSTAQTFSLGDSFYLNVNQATIANVHDLILSSQTQIDTNLTTLNTTVTRVSALEVGSYSYAVATGSSNSYAVANPAFAAYAAGNLICFKANFSVTGAATVNVNSLGAKSIKKADGATALASGDIVNGQIIECIYDGTNFQMLTPIGTAATSQNYVKISYAKTVANTVDVVSSSSDTAFVNSNYSAAPANFLAAAGDRFIVHFKGSFVAVASQTTMDLKIKIGTTVVATWSVGNQANTNKRFEWTVEVICMTAGASGKVYTKQDSSLNGAAFTLGPVWDSAGGGANNVAVDLTQTGISMTTACNNTSQTLELEDFYIERKSATAS